MWSRPCVVFDVVSSHLFNAHSKHRRRHLELPQAATLRARKSHHSLDHLPELSVSGFLSDFSSLFAFESVRYPSANSTD